MKNGRENSIFNYVENKKIRYVNLFNYAIFWLQQLNDMLYPALSDRRTKIRDYFRLIIIITLISKIRLLTQVYIVNEFKRNILQNS